MAFDLTKFDTRNIDAAMTAAVTGWSGLSYAKFKPDKRIPYDERATPIIRVIGWALLGLAAYQAWRTYMMWSE